MKKLILFLFAICFAGIAGAQIANSAHDLSGIAGVTYAGSANGQTCSACHIPHGSTINNGQLLWNQTVSAQTFQMYTSPTYPTAGNLSTTGISLKCLGCHDNTTTIHGSLTINNAALSGLGTGNGNVGTDLRNDHPVGIQITALAGSMKLPAAGTAKTFTAGGNQYVECGSCHNPHLTTYGSFLIMSNDNSNLCLACHIK